MSDALRELLEDKIRVTLKLGDTARRFVKLELELDQAAGDYDEETLTALMAARHDMTLLAGFPCGCDERTCPGVIG